MLCHMYLKGKIPCKQEVSFHWELIIRLINTNNYQTEDTTFSISQNMNPWIKYNKEYQGKKKDI